MARVNLLLIVFVLGSALYLVRTQYESRQLYTALSAGQNPVAPAPAASAAEGRP